MVEAVFGGHTAGAKHLAGFQRVQTLWDETMAESVVRHLQSFPHDNQRMVVLAGSHHIRYGFGIPRRVFRRLPVSYALIGSEEVEFPEHRLGQRMRVQMPAFPMPPYDYVVFTAYEDLPGDRVKLGVRMEEQDGRVVVLAVVPGSAAERGGVLAGDTILSLDGEPITERAGPGTCAGRTRRASRRRTLRILAVITRRPSESMLILQTALLAARRSCSSGMPTASSILPPYLLIMSTYSGTTEEAPCSTMGKPGMRFSISSRMSKRSGGTRPGPGTSP
jgi:hypothetical protein